MIWPIVLAAVMSGNLCLNCGEEQPRTRLQDSAVNAFMERLLVGGAIEGIRQDDPKLKWFLWALDSACKLVGEEVCCDRPEATLLWFEHFESWLDMVEQKGILHIQLILPESAVVNTKRTSDGRLRRFCEFYIDKRLCRLSLTVKQLPVEKYYATVTIFSITDFGDADFKPCVLNYTLKDEGDISRWILTSSSEDLQSDVQNDN